MKAFVLGAGEGMRLRPLTKQIPKPLIPIWNKPLITYAFDHLLDFGVEELIVNTHHLAECYDVVFPDGRYSQSSITFVREFPDILDSGGGLANIAEHVQEEGLIVYNGDILTDLPLEKAAEAHQRSNNLVTLVLRSEGPNRNVTLNEEKGKVCDLRHHFGVDGGLRVQFTGVSFVNREFMELIAPVNESIIMAWLRLIREQDALGGVLVDEGHWWDLGDRRTYLEVSRSFSSTGFSEVSRHTLKPSRIHPTARIDSSAFVDHVSVVGSKCDIEPGVRIIDSILWEGVQVLQGTELSGCIVAGVSIGNDRRISGRHIGVDL